MANALQTKFGTSDELKAVLGKSKTTRGKMMKGLWEYIKENKLQSKEDKRIIICDKRLTKLFGKAAQGKRELKVGKKTKKLRDGEIFMTQMTKPLQKHLIELD